MNKHRIDTMIPIAYKALSCTGIADEEGKIQKGFRRQISTFGAAVTTGTLLSAILFFSQKGKAEVDRTKLMDAIYEILDNLLGLSDSSLNNDEKHHLFKYAQKEKDVDRATELILDAAIALKLAMNLYELE